MRDDDTDDEIVEVDDTVIRSRRADAPAVRLAADPGVDAGSSAVEDTVIRPRGGGADGVDADGADAPGVDVGPTGVEDTVIRARRGGAGGADARGVDAPGVDAGHSAVEDTVIRPRGGGADGADAPGVDVGPSGVEDTVIRPRAVAPRAGAEPSDVADTVIRPRPAAGAVRPAEGDVVAPPRGRVDGDPRADVTVRGVQARPTVPGGPADGPVSGLPADPVRTLRVPSIRVGDQVFRLDRPVILGRRPALPRIVRGPEPQLVTVRSASGQVSSSHLLVQASGEAAVVEDLRSTNGTIVRPVAGKPFRMPSGGSAVVLTGTVVEIGDGNAVEILSPHLRASDLGPAPPDWP